MADPKKVLAEHGLVMPDDMDVTVVENNDNTVHITLPKSPDGLASLSDEELSKAAGGTYQPSDCPSHNLQTCC